MTGNRLPSAPEHLLSAVAGATHRSGLDTNLELVFTGKQFGDDLNTIEPTPDGQRVLLPGYTLWNAAANYATTDALTMFIAVKNLFDRTVIVDRSRGIPAECTSNGSRRREVYLLRETETAGSCRSTSSGP